LLRLVLDAAPGEKFIFFYSGYSDQQNVLDDTSEDGFDDVIITSDLQHIADNELNEILVQSLPDGCFLLAVFDAFDSGTLLDLPHHHCNSVYVPWQSKGERVTLTMRNLNVRHQAVGLSDPHGNPFSSIADVVARDNVRLLADPLPSPHPQMRIDTQMLVESTDDGQPTRHWGSIGAESEAYPTGEDGHPRSYANILSPTRCDSPVSYVKCDGWCGYDPFESRFALSLSACSDPQRAWDAPHGTLATVLCRYLEKHPRPSYRSLMTHVNFVLHGNARELHTYTRQQKKYGNDFDGEMDNFQQPKLSSLTKLNMDDILGL
jgi:hypothetical protein